MNDDNIEANQAAASDRLANPRPPELTIWGLDALQVHDLYWSMRGVQVVRPGIGLEHRAGTELYLLLDSRLLVLFDLRKAVDYLHWVNPRLLAGRVRGVMRRALVPHHATDADGHTTFYHVTEPSARPMPTRIWLTEALDVAAAWRDGKESWRLLRRQIPQDRRGVLSLSGVFCNTDSPMGCQILLGHIASHWTKPEAIIERARRVGAGVWHDVQTPIDAVKGGEFPVWAGAGRAVMPPSPLRGPVILWDRQTTDAELLNKARALQLEVQKS